MAKALPGGGVGTKAGGLGAGVDVGGGGGTVGDGTTGTAVAVGSTICPGVIGVAGVYCGDGEAAESGVQVNVGLGGGGVSVTSPVACATRVPRGCVEVANGAEISAGVTPVWTAGAGEAEDTQPAVASMMSTSAGTVDVWDRVHFMLD